MKTYVVFTIFFASLSFSLYSQSRLDSLHQNLEAAKQDSSLAVAYEALALYWKDNNTDSTQHYFAKSTRVLRTLPQDYAHNKLRYRIHGYVTTMFTDVNRFPEARVHILYMQHLALQYNNQTWLANSQLLLGLVAMQTNQMDTAKYYFDKAMAVALPKKVWDVTTKIYGNLGIYYFYNGQSDSSYHCMLEAVKYAKLSKHAYFLANAYNNLATLEFKRGNLNGSVRYLKESQKIYKQLKNRSGEMYALMNLANNYHQVGQESEALDTYFMALQINSGLKDQVMEASFYKNIGEVYFTIGDISNATVYLMKSITLRETLNDTKGLNNSLFMLSELMQREAKYLKAKQYLQEILTNCQTNGDDQFGNKTRASLANVYAELAMPDSAEYYFKKATEQLRENSQNLDLSYALLNYAAFCQAQSRISDAEKNYREAKQLFQETEDHPGEVGALNGLASLQWKQYNIATKKQYLSKIVNLASKA
ncbi:MAG: hypothetical protein RIS47_1266, partial [Bacteroidota bacterium]